MRFSPQALLAALPAEITPRRYWIAFSGGVDSLVLLHALASLRAHLADISLQAIHVDHGLSPHAADWAAQCARQCDALGVPMTLCRADAQPAAGESPEAAARAARYAAIAGQMTAGDCLLTAHHQDDQAETLLLQLLRGAGPRGLASMAPCVPFAAGWHARPLLGFRRDALLDHARAQGLQWLEDDSNSDTRFARNFLRHAVLPGLKSHFPALATTLSRSARRCAEAAELLQVLADADLQTVQQDAQTLSVSGLRQLGELRARNLLHGWIHARQLPLPSEAQLQRLWQDVVCAAGDAEPLLRWPGVEVRRYRDALSIQSPLPSSDPDWQTDWDLSAPLAVPGVGRLLAQPVQGEGVALAAVPASGVQVRLRRGGERLCVAGRQGRHALKKLFQEAGVPPWQRSRIPLLFAGERLLAVVGYWIAAEAIAAEGQPGLLFTLEV